MTDRDKQGKPFAQVAANYRTQYLAKHGKPFPGTDAQIIGWWNTNVIAGNASECDEYTLEDMRDYHITLNGGASHDR